MPSKIEAINVIARALADGDKKTKDYHDAFKAFHTEGKGG